MRSDIAIVGSEEIDLGRQYVLCFDKDAGWPTRAEVLERMELIMGDELFASCRVDVENIRIGRETLHVDVKSLKQLPARFHYTNIKSQMRDILSDTRVALLVSAGEKVEFADGAARYAGVVRVVGNLTAEHQIFNTDTSQMDAVAAFSVVNVENGKKLQAGLRTPEMIVKDQLYKG